MAIAIVNTMGACLVPIGAMWHAAGVWPGPVFLRLAPGYRDTQGHTICENTPFSGLPTVIDERYAGQVGYSGYLQRGPWGQNQGGALSPPRVIMT